MDVLLATGLINLGNNLVNKVFGSSSDAASGTDFDSVLKSQMQDGTATDSTTLKSRIESLGDKLAALPEVRNFVGAGNDFTVKQDGNGYVIVREDGMQLRLQRNGIAEDCARDLNSCSVAQDYLDGTASDREWEVRQSA